MLLYQFFEALGLRGAFMRLVSRLPEEVQRRLGLVPVRVPTK